jgi:rhodanese-related sulfurtransferase
MTLRYKIFTTIKVCIFIAACFPGSASAVEKPYAPEKIPGATSVFAEEVVDLILSNPELIIIDSRKKTEYIKGHIEGAINILNTELMLEDLEVIAPDRGRALLFYCNGVRCLRSSDAINKAVEWGYTNIFWFRGGWNEWTDKRLPVVTE